MLADLDKDFFCPDRDRDSVNRVLTLEVLQDCDSSRDDCKLDILSLLQVN